MKKNIFLFIALILTSNGLSQNHYKGTWSGIIYKKNINKGEPIHLSFFIIDDIVNGYCKKEKYKKNDFIINKTVGKYKNDSLFIKEHAIVNHNKSSRVKKKYRTFELIYNDTTGYINGKCHALRNKNEIEYLTLYKVDNSYRKLTTTPLSHSWFGRLKEDLKNGYYSPIKREIERNKFKFVPIYFDYDKAEVKKEYDAFLKKMIRVVNGHTDLRIKVIGHTDSDGSDSYNVNLSERRAKSIIKYFTKNGISADKIEIDFKGESEPVDTNNTPEGKQRNRRVDFSFI